MKNIKAAGLLLMALASPLFAAMPGGVSRSPAPMLPRAAAPSLRAPDALRAEETERRRVKAVWAGTVVKTVEARVAGIVAETPQAGARAALQKLAKGLSKEEELLRADRAGAFEELMRAKQGSRIARSWRQAIEVDTVLLDEYPAAFAAIARASDRL